MLKRTIVQASVLLAVGLVSGCSDAVPPAALGAFQSTLVGSTTCGVEGHNGQIGTVDSNRISNKQKDSINGADIGCAIVDQGGGKFEITATMVQGTTGIQIDVPSISSSATEAEPANGTVSYRHQKTLVYFKSPQDEPCKFWFKNQEQVAPGRFWASFSCPKVVDASTGRDCSLSESVISLENCAE